MRSPRPIVLPAMVALAVVGCGSASDLDSAPDDETTAATTQPPAPEPSDPSGVGPEDPKKRTITLAGSVALDNCSGSLVRFTASEPADPALVLTNGHCYEGGFIDAGQVFVDTPSSRTMALLDADGNPALDLRATSIAYATMTDTDVLLYRVDQTYEEIEQATGLPALTLAADRAAVGTEISVVSGYWKRIYTCTVDSYVHRMHEADWTWNESMQYRQPGCEIIGGTSGSPVISHDTGEVVAVNNTSNEQGRRCALNNPCEESPNGRISVEQGESYAQQTALLYTCLADSRELDLTLDGCLLPAPA